MSQIRRSRTMSVCADQPIGFRGSLSSLGSTGSAGWMLTQPARSVASGRIKKCNKAPMSLGCLLRNASSLRAPCRYTLPSVPAGTRSLGPLRRRTGEARRTRGRLGGVRATLEPPGPLRTPTDRQPASKLARPQAWPDRRLARRNWIQKSAARYNAGPGGGYPLRGAGGFRCATSGRLVGAVAKALGRAGVRSRPLAGRKACERWPISLRNMLEEYFISAPKRACRSAGRALAQRAASGVLAISLLDPSR